jgi:hypothetical protein
MNRWRRRHADYKAAQKSDSGSTDAESVYDTAAQHRANVIAREKTAQARKKKAVRRG